MKLILTLVAAIGLIAFGYLTIEDRYVPKTMAKDGVNLYTFGVFCILALNFETDIFILKILNIASIIIFFIMFASFDSNKVIYRVASAMNLGIIALYSFIEPNISMKYLVFTAILGSILILHTALELFFRYN